MNRVLLTGRLTRDPEMRSLPSGKAVTKSSSEHYPTALCRRPSRTEVECSLRPLFKGVAPLRLVAFVASRSRPRWVMWMCPRVGRSTSPPSCRRPPSASG
jgi:hypothetical protein